MMGIAATSQVSGSDTAGNEQPDYLFRHAPFNQQDAIFSFGASGLRSGHDDFKLQLLVMIAGTGPEACTFRL